LSDPRLRGGFRRAATVLLAVHLVSAIVAGGTGLRVVQTLRTERGIEASQQAVARFANAAREQYVHQAHTLLQADPSHLGHDADAALLAEAALLALESHDTLHPEDRERAHHAWAALSSGFLADVAALGLSPASDVSPGAPPPLEALRAAHQRLERHAEAVETASRAMRTHLDALAARERARVETALRACALALVGLLVTALAAAFRVTRSLEEADLARREAETRRIEAERLAALGELSAAVAHEVLNPIAAIVATTDDPVVRAEAAHARRVVEGMLGFARGGRGEPAVMLSIADEARAAADRLAVRSDARDVTLRLVADGSPTLEAPAGAVRQVLDNLLRNALDAAPVGSTVELRVDADGIAVMDDGDGISETVRPRLYTPFATGRPDGTGLGLAVAARIVRALGGALSHEDRHPPDAPARGTVARWRFRA
jgi:two-component system NtrC family sensor kinase